MEVSDGLGTAIATNVNNLEEIEQKCNHEKIEHYLSYCYQVVKTLLTTDNDSISDTSFKLRRQFTGH